MIHIALQHDSSEEHDIKTILERLLDTYTIPIFTHDVIIAKGAVPHSHPILTLNCRSKHPLLLLQVFVHEQLHWFADGHAEYENVISFLKTQFVDNEKPGVSPNAFWEHIIVCFNTRKFLIETLDQTEIEFIYSEWQAYPYIEQLVEKEYDRIEDILKKFDMILL